MTDTNTCTLFADYNTLVNSITALKSSTNPHFKNRFAPLDAWLDEVHRLCPLNNFILLEKFDTRESTTGEMYVTHTATLLHQQGFKQESTYLVSVLDKPQQMGAAATYARRYNIQTLLTGTGEDDDDGNIAQTSTVTDTRTPITMKRKLA